MATAPTIKPISVDGVDYYLASDFARLIGRSDNAVYRLISKGNCIRRLFAEYKKFGKPLVLASEFTEFPFTAPGRYAYRSIFHFNAEGEAVMCDICNTKGVGHCPNTKGRK